MASWVLYGGLGLALLGALSLIRPLRSLRICNRRTGMLVLAAGVGIAVGTALLPSRLVRAAATASRVDSRIDAFLPEFHFDEHHEVVVNAPAERVYKAIKEVRPGEIRLLMLLTGLRTLRPDRVFGRVPPLASQPPMLTVSQRSGFLLLAEDAGREIVQGACGQFWRLRKGGDCPGVDSPEAFLAFQEPGYAKAAINFRVVPEGAACRVITETRILATDDRARRRFGAYWRAIYPGSALIRITWLDAIKRRAETPGY
jgi:hypothetical protein